jgi:hypothetical protein
MKEVSKQVNLYKIIKENGYLDFPNINVRVLYYHDLLTDNEYSIHLDLSNLHNVVTVERFKTC